MCIVLVINYNIPVIHTSVCVRVHKLFYVYRRHDNRYAFTCVCVCVLDSLCVHTFVKCIMISMLK